MTRDVGRGARGRAMWFVVFTAPDVPGQWVVIGLDLGVVSQGNSRAHALAMGLEAVSIVVADDVARGVDPFATRGPAPASEWTPLRATLEAEALVEVGRAGKDEGDCPMAVCAWVDGAKVAPRGKRVRVLRAFEGRAASGRDRGG